MYYITDKKAAVRQVQKFLFLLSDTIYTSIPRIPIDGVYNGETKQAVEKFQALMNLEVTGIVDFITFSSLYDEYLKVFEWKNMRDYVVGDTEFPMVIGTYTEDVRVLHVLINELKKTYTEIPDVGKENFYTTRTAKAVEYLRKIFRFSDGEHVDKELFDRILKETDARHNINQKYS